MKKRTLSLLAIVLSLLLACIFAACEDKPDPQPDGDTTYTYALNVTQKTLKEGEELELKVTVTPTKEIAPTWSVTSTPATGVVSLSATTGTTIKVTAGVAGTATVKATVDDEVLECKITVKEDEEEGGDTVF